ncbi:hypothetical protein M422DRAFT_249754 [Sphaerobolus stellatus SS14]|uniref:ATP-dependent DNA helicase n=1 Tax=Sphaerobolus stellatus (strain SS14) TaxID=990650 RepID=A0A0C9W3K0_SPHS4|nr:hypothetical protein M422DRAFT_249754 [Sphaerobolus stellatus SS14]
MSTSSLTKGEQGSIPSRFLMHHINNFKLIQYFYQPWGPEFEDMSYIHYFEIYVHQTYRGQELAPDEYLKLPIPGTEVHHVISKRIWTHMIARLQTILLSYEDLCTVNGILHTTFHEAAIAFGIFNDTNEGYYTMEEAVASLSPPVQLRFLFSHIILEGYPTQPLWQAFHEKLAEDYVCHLGSRDMAINQCLLALANFLVFLEGKPGRGKTFLIDALAAYLCSQGRIVMVIATSALAASMYEQAYTAHSMFKIPVDNDTVIIQSKVKPDTNWANLICHTAVIIWDELPLANKATLECVNHLCQELPNNDLTFGGIPFIGIGDFRQVSPVIKGQGPMAKIQASIKSSNLWSFFHVQSLHLPIRSAADLEYTALVNKTGEDTTNLYTTITLVD